MVPKNLQSSNGQTDIENRCTDTGGVTWKLTSPNVRQIPNENLMYVSGNSKQGLCISLEGVMGKEMGGRFKREGHIYTYAWFMLRFNRKQQDSVRQSSFN